MKKAKKILTLALSACLLVAITIGATVAYLTDEQSVTNTFTIGNVEIILDEADVYEFGDVIPEPEEGEEPLTFGDPIEGAPRVDKNSYKLFPGHEYTKDPTTHVVAGSEECYVRNLVTVSFDNALSEDILKTSLDGIVIGYSATDWPRNSMTISTDGKSIVYEYRYKETVDASAASANVDLPALFTAIKVPDDFDGNDLAAIAGMKIEVVAQAIQADGFDDADEAWKAFSATPAEPVAPADEEEEDELEDQPPS